MRATIALVLAVPMLAADPWPLERLYTRPFIWGTTPEQIHWSKQGETLLFLWNAEGRRFLDLYAWRAGKRVRLTDLESVPDELNRGEAETDDRRKRYLLPPSGIADYSMSDDGRRAAFAFHGDLWVVETSGGKPPLRLTHTKTPEGAPGLSPDGGRLAYVRDGQLLVQDLTDGRTWQVTDVAAGQSLSGYEWSPDGKRFAYTTRVGQSRRMVLPNYSGRLVTAAPFGRTLAGDDPLEARAFVVASEGGATREMEAGPWGGKVYTEGACEWSPDSARLLRRVVHPLMKQAQILALDANTGKATVLFEDRDAAWIEPPFAGWSPDGKQVFFTSEKDGFFNLYRAALAEPGMALPVATGRFEIHKESFGRDAEWKGEYLYFSSTEPTPSERQFWRIRPDGTGKERLSKGEGIHVGTPSADGKRIALLTATLDAPFDLYVDGARVTESPRPDFARYPWPKTKFVSFPSRGDGKTVAAKMLLPPGYDPSDKSKQWPAVFFIHGAGYATSVLKQWGSYLDVRYVFNCYLANRGYVVLDMDYRGSSGYGRDWRTDVYLHLGGKDLEDVLGGVEYLKTLGNVDTRRLGMWGVSYGGFMTNMALFQAPGVFRAGASWAAVNDWENYNAGYTEERLRKPATHPEAYRRSSPIHFSGGLRDSLLIVHGMVDSNVLFQDAVQLAEKLIHEGKRFEQAYYPEENHLFVRDESLIDAFRRTAEFLERELR